MDALQPIDKHTFLPGRSGNPLGRPQTNIELRDMAREYLQDALNVLVQIVENKRSPSSARINASNILLDYGWGKPIQHVESVKTQMTLEEYLSSLDTTDVDEMEAREAGLDWDSVNNRLADPKDIVVIDDAEEDYAADF